MLAISEEFRNRVLAEGIASANKMVGCSDQDIAVIEDQFAIRLPVAYRDFLRIMGRRGGNYRVGEDIYFPDILDLRDSCQSLLDSDSNSVNLRLSPQHFVFAGHQDYLFHFFDTTNPIDPPVFSYYEGNANFDNPFLRFSDYLFSGLDPIVSPKA